MQLKKQPILMNNDGRETYQGLLDQLDPTSPSYDKDLKRRLKHRPVSSREQGIIDYLTANNMAPRKNQRIAPTFLTNTGGRSNHTLMRRDHTPAYGSHISDLNVTEVTPNAASNPATRIEEDIHSLQKNILDWDKPLSRSSRKNKKALTKELGNADFTEEEYERRVKDNYALSGSGSVLEFEAKMIATKMMLLEQGVIESADETITEKKLDEIIAWKRNQFDWDNAEEDSKAGKSHDFTTVLYTHDSPKMRELLLKTLNDL